MENQDKNIDKHFRKLAEEQQPKSFQNMDKVWNEIEQKLDQKDKKKAFPFWKYAGIAAAVLVFVSLGIQFMNNQPEKEEHLPIETEKRIVVDEKKAKEILDEQTESKEDVYAYEDVEDLEEKSVKGETHFTEVEVKRDEVPTKAFKTSQEDFDDSTTSGRADKETDYGYGLKSGGRQTGKAEEPSQSQGAAPSNHYDRNEIIVDEYRTISKSRSNTAVSTVTSKTIEGRPNASFVQTLQGQVPGLNISSGSGQPDANNAIVLRGLGSINNNTDPLFIIDGVPMSKDKFLSLNQKDIENITVLKDTGATAIYGNRGANGVINITTKKGAKKKSRKERRKEKQESVSYQEIQKMFPPVEIDSESYESF